ncbi:glycoside hydrolase family 5 protein [bacterium]|nr:glycoside hydrolase family 5 protein [bacterium]
MILFINCCPRTCPLSRTVSGQDKNPSFVDLHGALAVSGTQLVDMHGDSVVLRGVSLGWHNWWPQYWNADVVKWLKEDWKITVLRAAMGIGHTEGYLNKPRESAALLKKVVDACIAQGIYVIIDWHDHDAQNHQEAAIAFFREMAGTYGHTPNVIYEIYNEPDFEDWPTVKAYADTLIRTIRAKDPHNIILVGTTQWDQNVHIAADDPLTGHSNVMYTLHFYAITHRQWLRDRGDYALSKGLPLFVSEMDGSNASGRGGLDLEEWQQWMDWMENNQISWIKWSISDKQETCSSLKPGASPHGGWTKDMLTESGLRAREYIRTYTGN